jgi:hypothetical protein
MARTVTAAEDWLSYALAEYDTDKIAASNKRAEAALKVRLDQRVTSFLRRSIDGEELTKRLDIVDPAVREIVDEVATEYGANPEHLTQVAVASVRKSVADYLTTTYEHDTVAPDKVIGDTPASSAFEGMEFDKSQETSLSGSKDHPREFQNVADHVEDRRTLNDGTDKDVGVERAIDHQSLDSNPYTEQEGKGGTFTEGDRGSAGAADAVTSKFHLLD